MFSSSADAPACSISRAKSVQPARDDPFRLAMTGTPTAAARAAHKVQIAVRTHAVGIGDRAGKIRLRFRRTFRVGVDAARHLVSFRLDLLLEQRRQHDRAGAGVLETADIVEPAVQRGGRCDQGVLQRQAEIIGGQCHNELPRSALFAGRRDRLVPTAWSLHLRRGGCAPAPRASGWNRLPSRRASSSYSRYFSVTAACAIASSASASSGRDRASEL